MTFSALAATTGVSPKRSSREGAEIDTFLIHHMASRDGDGTTAMMLSAGGRTVSSNYTIMSDGRIRGVVPENERAWTSGSASDGGKGSAWDRRSITVEIANTRGEPDWYIGEQQIDAAARLLIDLRGRHPIRNVMGHRDLYERYRASYPTYCPGPDTVERILAREAEINRTQTPREEDDMTEAEKQMLKEIHELLFTDGKERKDWAPGHKLDHLHRMTVDPVIEGPVKGERWTLHHLLGWIARTLATLVDHADAVENHLGIKRKGRK